MILTSVCVIAIPACQSVKPTVTTVTSSAQTTSTPQNTLVTTSFGAVNSASSESVDGLSLSLSLDSTTYQPGQAVTIVIDETNTLSKTNNVSAADKWPFPGLSVGPCGTLNYPFGVAIFQGNYTRQGTFHLQRRSSFIILLHCITVRRFCQESVLTRFNHRVTLPPYFRIPTAVRS